MINDALDEQYMLRAKDGEVKKKSFAPSGLGYMSSNCPRRWVLAFRGTDADNITDSLGFINMEFGLDRHARLQEKLSEYDWCKEVEYELTNDDPPIHGFVDAIIEWEGDELPLEIKTCRPESFYSKKNTHKPTSYHMIQLLLYMYLLKKDKGCFLYENKADGQRLFIKISMNEDNKQKIEQVLNWMRDVYAAYKTEKLPSRPYKQTSPVCKSCIFYNSCWSIDDEQENMVKIPTLKKLF